MATAIQTQIHMSAMGGLLADPRHRPRWRHADLQGALVLVAAAGTSLCRSHNLPV